MDIELPLLRALGLGERVDQRPAVHLPVVLIERPDHRASVPPGPGRVVLARRRLPRDRVHRARSRSARTALPRRLPDRFQPQREVTSLSPASEIPANRDRVQETEPRQQLIGVRPQRCRARVVGEHVMQELRDRGDLGALPIDEPERQQRITGLFHPPGPGHRQRRNIPDSGAVLWHPYLRRPPRSTTSDESRSTPPHAVTPTGEPGQGRSHGHCPLTPEAPQMVPPLVRSTGPALPAAAPRPRPAFPPGRDPRQPQLTASPKPNQRRLARRSSRDSRSASSAPGASSPRWTRSPPAAAPPSTSACPASPTPPAAQSPPRQASSRHGVIHDHFLVRRRHRRYIPGGTWS